MENMALADGEQEKARPGRWQPGTSGNPTGTKNSTRFKELHAAMLAEFAGVELTASDKALLENAARLLARRMKSDDNAVKATNAARIIITTLHQRHKKARSAAQSQDTSSGPLRDRLAARDVEEPAA